MNKKILVVDDDLFICDAIAKSLAPTFEVVSAYDVESAYRIATQGHIHGVVLDVKIGSENGIELCMKLRQNQLTQHLPILMMTGFGSKEKLMNSFKAGADDYVEKPIDMDELLARLNTRIKSKENSDLQFETVSNLKAFYDRNEIEINGEIIQLSQVEINLLKIFLNNLNKKITRDEIYNSLWKGASVELRTVDVHVSLLRKKIKDFNCQIVSLYGSGYILKPK